MPEFKIADGFVDVEAHADRASARRAANVVVDETEDELGRGRSRNRIGRAFAAMFRPNRAVLMTLRTGIPAVLSSPIGLSAVTLAAVFAIQFVAALGAALITAGLPAVFIGLGALLLKDNAKIVAGFEDMLGRIKEAFEGTADSMIKPFLKAMKLIGAGAERVAPMVEKLFEIFSPAIVPVVEGLISAVEKFFEALLSDPGALENMKNALIAFADNAPRLGKALAEIFLIFANNEDVLKSIPILFSIIINTGKLLASIISFWVHGLVFWAARWHDLQNATGEVWRWISGTLWPGLTGFFSSVWQAGVNAVNFIKNAWSTVVGFFGGILASIGTFIAGVVKFFQELPGRIFAFVGTIPGRLQAFFINAFDLVTYAIGAGIGIVLGFFIQLPGRIMNAIRVLPGWLAELFNNVRNRMTSIISGAISAVVSFFRGLPGRAISAASSIVSRIGSLISSAASRARSTASSLVRGFVNIIRGLPGKAASAMSSLGSRIVGVVNGIKSRLYTAGRGLIVALINGVTSMVGWAISVGGRAIQNIGKGIADFLPGSPVRKGPLRVLNDGYAGGQIVKMIVNGMRDETNRLRDSFSGVLGDAVTPITQPAPVPVAAGPTYNFAPGSVVLDASRIKSVGDLITMIESLRPTARQFGARTVTP